MTVPPSARGAVVTAACPHMRPALHDLALPTFRRWARGWGWTVLAHDLACDGVGADDGAQSAKWAKVRLLREALEHHPLALWLDADVLLLREDEDISVHLHPDHFRGEPQHRRLAAAVLPPGVRVPRRDRARGSAARTVGGPGCGARSARLGPRRRALPLGPAGHGRSLPRRDELAPTRMEPAMGRRAHRRRVLQQRGRLLR